MVRQLAAISRFSLPRQAYASRAFSVSLASRKSVVDSAKDVLDKANKKTGEFLAGTINKTEQAAGHAEEAASDAAQKASLKVDEVKAQKKVNDNTQGYLNLQDKGAKVESEQNRPDDAV